jgi:uncharacterized protein with HEPN domain
MKDDKVYLKHIQDSILQIEKYLDKVEYLEFKNRQILLDAVVRQLEIIGEATNNLSSDFREKYSEIYYRDIVDMRNFLIHEYFGVDPKIVWDTCKYDLPNLKNEIKKILTV